MTTLSYRAGAIATAIALVLAGAPAWAHVLDKKDDAAAYKLRATVAKQLSSYGSCLMKAVVKCEAKGASSAPECDPTTGVVAYEPVPGAESAKFQAAVAKCDTKLDPDEKSTDYIGIGCPGDCDTGAAGTQACTSLAAYESQLESAAGLKGEVAQLQLDVDAACASAGAPASAERIDCVKDATKALTTYRQSLLKCQQNCEADTKGTKGGGGLTNAPVCLVPGGHASVIACADKAATKLEGAATTVAPSIVSAANALVTDLYNREKVGDPASPAGDASPCGTCGDAVREGAEECDGMGALGDCEACAADCTCTPAVCGNGVIEGAEVCDGAALGTCTTSCAGDCTCVPPPVCGNGVIEGTEVCDGAALGTCTTSCAGDCTCVPPPTCGNGTIEGTEACDGTALGSCSACAGDCTCIIDPILDGPAGTFCTTSVNTAITNYQPLCAPAAGSGHHFRMEGIYMGSVQNGFVYLALGFPAGLETSTTAPATPTDGDGRFVFTAGKSTSCAFSWNYFRYSSITSPAANPCSAPKIFDGYRDTGDYPGARTVCLDVTGANPARVTFWATGANGADCNDKSTLTALTALYSKDDWSSANIQPISQITHYAKINNVSLATMTSVSVSSNTVLP